MSNSAIETIGKILPDSVTDREAVHLPVTTLIAGEPLWRGHPVKLAYRSKTRVLGTSFVYDTPPPIGIVDPFRDGLAPKGRRVNVYLRPGLAGPARHKWSFVDELEKGIESDARDMAHVCLLPVECGDYFQPNSEVCLHPKNKSIAVPRQDGQQVAGYIDPFLSEHARKGQRVWLFVGPWMVSPVAHWWDFPLIDGDQVRSQSASEEWLRRFAYEWGMDFDKMIEEAGHGVITTASARGEKIHSRRYNKVKEKFWAHMADYTGQKISEEFKSDAEWGCDCRE